MSERLPPTLRQQRTQRKRLSLQYEQHRPASEQAMRDAELLIASYHEMEQILKERRDYAKRPRIKRPRIILPIAGGAPIFGGRDDSGPTAQEEAPKLTQKELGQASGLLKAYYDRFLELPEYVAKEQLDRPRSLESTKTTFQLGKFEYRVKYGFFPDQGGDEFIQIRRIPLLENTQPPFAERIDIDVVRRGGISGAHNILRYYQYDSREKGWRWRGANSIIVLDRAKAILKELPQPAKSEPKLNAKELRIKTRELMTGFKALIPHIAEFQQAWATRYFSSDWDIREDVPLSFERNGDLFTVYYAHTWTRDLLFISRQTADGVREEMYITTTDESKERKPTYNQVQYRKLEKGKKPIIQRNTASAASTALTFLSNFTAVDS